MIPLVKRDGMLHILFEVRSQSIRQGGEICFPGGHIEGGETRAETAVRETREELLLDPSQICLIAPLHTMSNGPRGAEVSSFAGIIHHYEDTGSSEEVERTFLLPLRKLMEMQPIIYEADLKPVLPDDFPFDLIPGGRAYPWSGVRKKYYFYQTDEGVIWGMTAELLFHFLETVRDYGVGNSDGKECGII
ncbi:MAG: CoA pyrophosphatase [Lachnospiraceae bacterium]|nr:CoA pyrophosphatase [Lachnospiraceae bacterium]